MSALYGFTSLKQQDLNNKGAISRIRWEFELASRAAALEQSSHKMDMEIEMEEQAEREQVRTRSFSTQVKSPNQQVFQIEGITCDKCVRLITEVKYSLLIIIDEQCALNAGSSRLARRQGGAGEQADVNSQRQVRSRIRSKFEFRIWLRDNVPHRYRPLMVQLPAMISAIEALVNGKFKAKPAESSFATLDLGKSLAPEALNSLRTSLGIASVDNFKGKAQVLVFETSAV